MLKLSDSSEPPSTDDIHVKFDIRHTAPQHRTHLEYGGFGLVACGSSKMIEILIDFVFFFRLFSMGTPSQRQTAYYKMRAEQAQERVHEYRRDRESVETREELIERKKRKDIRAT